MRLSRSVRPVLLAVALANLGFAIPLTISETVAGNAQPWIAVNGGLNTGFQYGVQDGAAPVAVSAADGILFNPGLTLTIQYISGIVNTGGGAVSGDANGVIVNTFAAFDGNAGFTGNGAPSRYMSGYPPHYLQGELVGVFTDALGNIVGTPFGIGDGSLVVTIPIGATRLQLGLNDDLFSDNTGFFLVDVTGQAPAIPEPATFSLALAGLATIARFARRQRRI